MEPTTLYGLIAAIVVAAGPIVVVIAWGIRVHIEYRIRVADNLLRSQIAESEAEQRRRDLVINEYYTTNKAYIQILVSRQKEAVQRSVEEHEACAENKIELMGRIKQLEAQVQTDLSKKGGP